MRGARLGPGSVVSIPMMRDRPERLGTDMEMPDMRLAYLDGDRAEHGENLFFVPSQALWSERRLPPSMSLLEPIRAYHHNDMLEFLSERYGNVVLGYDNVPYAAFDHVLPALIPRTVEAWRIACWFREDLRIQ